MARYEITLTVDEARKASVEKKLREAFGEDVPVHSVAKLKTAESRGDRLGGAESSLEDAKSVVGELKDEIQNWIDSLPENLQGGSKSDELNACLSELEELESNLDNCDFGNVSFPGMY